MLLNHLLCYNFIEILTWTSVRIDYTKNSNKKDGDQWEVETQNSNSQPGNNSFGKLIK